MAKITAEMIGRAIMNSGSPASMHDLGGGVLDVDGDLDLQAIADALAALPCDHEWIAPTTESGMSIEGPGTCHKCGATS